MYHLAVNKGLSPDGFYLKERIIKSSSHKEYIICLLYSLGYIYTCRKGEFIDNRFRILKD